ncbi:hypothetical protein [Micromonospora inyonensis]|uniref:Uncharacterized protein n=1 Tax=Micromonospora inyonensis TaxID=47866 RepID=A0A1C6SEL0_9ACTN|nr:hypothetical protein [Micromonospora inyonensis]SCL27833.1 hypothetical protein GA0074694_4927 [Micromonospora inyonensis]
MTGPEQARDPKRRDAERTAPGRQDPQRAREPLTARVARFLGAPFGLGVLACLALAGWALWTGGITDGPVARDVRSSSVHVAPGVDLDEAAAERIIGNRRLVVLLLEPGADLREGCQNVERAADGTVVLVLSREDDEYDTYGCALLPGRDDGNFGRAFVAEMTISNGIDGFVDRPLEALKVVTVNYDRLVKAGTVPDGTRTISPSLPRYLVAVAAVLAVLVGSALVYATGLRAGRLAADRRRLRDAHADRRSALSAATAVLAQQVIDLDQRYARMKPTAIAGDADHKAFVRDYPALVSDYTDLLDTVTPGRDRDDTDLVGLIQRVESLSRRADQLARTARMARPRSGTGAADRSEPAGNRSAARSGAGHNERHAEIDEAPPR